MFVCTRETIQFCRTGITRAQRKARLGAAEALLLKDCFTLSDI